MPIQNDTPELTSAKTDISKLAGLWKLYFARGPNPRGELIFAFNGTKEAAIARGREHCVRIDAKFIRVEPFLVDLEQSERDYAKWAGR